MREKRFGRNCRSLSDRSADWAGLRPLRGLIPRASKWSHQSHLRRCCIVVFPETNACHLVLRLSTVPAAAAAPRSMIYLGMDVHKDSITIAVLLASAKGPTRMERLPNDLPKLQTWLARLARDGELHARYEVVWEGSRRERSPTPYPDRSSASAFVGPRQRRNSSKNGRSRSYVFRDDRPSSSCSNKSTSFSTSTSSMGRAPSRTRADASEKKSRSTGRIRTRGPASPRLPCYTAGAHPAAYLRDQYPVASASPMT